MIAAQWGVASAAVPDEPIILKPRSRSGPLSVEQLETGLRLLDQGDVDHKAFWDENIEAFRRTVLLAIRETSEALLSPTITLHWRVELESQLEALVQYIELADRYLARRPLLSPEQLVARRRLQQVRLH